MGKKKGKYLVSILFFISFIFVGCGNNDIVGNFDEVDGWKVFISDVKREFNVEVGEIVVRDDSSKEICTVDGSDSDKIKVDIDEKNKKIVIENKKQWMSSVGKIKININVPIGYLEIENGNFKLDIVEVEEKFQGIFKCGITGEIGLSKADEVELDIKGAGSVKLLGEAENTYISIEGGVGVDGLDFKTNKAIIRVEGVGNVSINVDDFLDANLKGVGQILYKGNPKIKNSIDGLGEIEKLKE